MKLEFEALMKQASYMTKLATNLSPSDEASYQSMVKKLYNNPESNQLLSAALKRKAQDPKTYAQSSEYAHLKANVDHIKGELSKQPLAQRAMKKQASAMTKFARTFTDGPDEMEEYDRLWQLPFKHNTHGNPEYRQMQQQYGQAYNQLRQDQPFERPERTTAEKIKQYAYPAIGLGLGLGGAYGAMRLKKALVNPQEYSHPYGTMVASPLLGLGAGAFAGNIGYGVRTMPAHDEYHKDLVSQLEQQEAPLVKSMGRIEEAARNERLNHPDVQAFIKRFGYNPFDEEGV